MHVADYVLFSTCFMFW